MRPLASSPTTNAAPQRCALAVLRALHVWAARLGSRPYYPCDPRAAEKDGRGVDICNEGREGGGSAAIRSRIRW